MMIRKFLLVGLILCFAAAAAAEDGYQLWLRYVRVQDPHLREQYTAAARHWSVAGNSATAEAARNELRLGLSGLLGKAVVAQSSPETAAGVSLIAGTPASSALVNSTVAANRLEILGSEGYVIFQTVRRKARLLVVAANTDIGVLYGIFHLLRLMQTGQSLQDLELIDQPKVKLRLMNHWDNLDRTVERGYAGFSIWDWHRLPDYLPARYTDYARANASVGINGVVLTNVNANALVLRSDYLEKAAALAKVFRTYGIRVYLTARFSAPVELGGLTTADPLDTTVVRWWREKADEIYRFIPDFGGFLVKANSEGQPGPQFYSRTHVDGANLLADALAPHNGVVMWRAFVYSDSTPEDRAKQAYNEFVPFDGKFRENVLVQVKNGPIDFQPREPAHPIFGAMPRTPLMMEFQITQEYLGQATHLVYLGTLFKETLAFDTYAQGMGSSIARIVEGRLDHHARSGIAGVSNIGTDRNWTGHPFGQANWYAFGRLAWDPDLDAGQLAEEWIRMTYSNDPAVIAPLKSMMMQSREFCVQYMTPLGLHHLMASHHHYGPGPWVDDLSRADWNPVYYHKADREGIGFDRTPSGSNATEQYFSPVRERFVSRDSCPEALLLWFHHVKWTDRLQSGQTLWEALCLQYEAGMRGVAWMRNAWASVAGKIDAERFAEVDMLLRIQEKEAHWWHDACLEYFQSKSNLPFPVGVSPPEKSLDYYENLTFPYAPGISPKW